MTRQGIVHALADSYCATLTYMLTAISADQSGALEQAITAVAAALLNDGIIHVAGSGHSHMLAEEVFYRAGGLAAAQAILDPVLMLHLGAQHSTQAEREEGRAATVLARYTIKAGDVVFVASNSGRNAYPIEVALEAKRLGAKVIAITSVQTAKAVTSRHPSGKLLPDVVDIVIDNQAPVGDASLRIPGLDPAMAPVSTITGVFILNSIMAEAAARVAAQGKAVDVYDSANGPQGASPADIAAKWQSRIIGL